MASVVSNLVSTVGVTEVEKIVITDEAQIPGGNWVRAIKVYGTPNGVEGDPVLIVQLTSSTLAKILIEAPKTTF